MHLVLTNGFNNRYTVIIVKVSSSVSLRMYPTVPQEGADTCVTLIASGTQNPKRDTNYLFAVNLKCKAVQYPTTVNARLGAAPLRRTIIIHG